MKKLITLLATGLLLSLVMKLHAQSISKTLDAFDHPEGAVATGDFLYVSNIGPEGKATAKDGDGFISKVSKNGEVEQLHFLPSKDSLNAPKGMAVAGNTLYVADINRVVGFNLSSGQQVFELKIPEAQFLNDIAAQNAQTLYVSATSSDKIARIDINKKSYHFLDLPKLNGPNGLAFGENSNTLYCVGFGTDNKPNGLIYEITLDPISRGIVNGYSGHIDGVQYRDGSLYISDWIAFEKNGLIKKVDLASGDVSTVDLGQPLGGPADIALDPNSGKLYIPALLENKFYIVTL